MMGLRGWLRWSCDEEGAKRTLLCLGRKPFMGLFAMSHFGKRVHSSGERLREKESSVPIVPLLLLYQINNVTCEILHVGGTETFFSMTCSLCLHGIESKKNGTLSVNEGNE